VYVIVPFPVEEPPITVEPPLQIVTSLPALASHCAKLKFEIVKNNKKQKNRDLFIEIWLNT
jgi:hypothetical protein